MSDDDRDFLDHPFITDLPAEAQQHLKDHVIGPVTWKAGTEVFREGGDADVWYLIMHGTVALEVHTPGREDHVVMTLSDGDVLGWSWLFPPYRWSFGAHVRTETEALEVDGAKLRAHLENCKELGYDVLYQFSRLIVSRMNATRLQLLDLYADRT